jgi:hypothetical protein
LSQTNCINDLTYASMDQWDRFKPKMRFGRVRPK